MSDPGTTRLDVAGLLKALHDAPPVMAADVLGTHLTDAFGASEVSLLVADFSGRSLTRLGHAGTAGADRTNGRETAERVSLDGTIHGRVLVTQAVDVERHEGGVRVVAPVTHRGEAIGVLELSLAEDPERTTVADVAVAAHVLSYSVIANRLFTDLFDWGQRSVPLTLAAEVQHRLLPGAFTCEGEQFALAGWLEPAGEIAGDTFDFAVERDTLHLSVTDAMGHGVQASVLATLLVSGLRNARRAGLDLVPQAAAANEALGNHVTWRGDFVTGQVARIDLRSGTAAIVNAGHPAPLRLRGRSVERVALEVDPPFGIIPECRYRAQVLPLEKGDRLVFLTDGMLERNGASLPMEAKVVETAGMHPREAVQYLTRAVLEATDGELQDDATLLCFDWHR